MGRLEDYVEAVTRRLRRDPELHMDIAHELRCHLEEAVEEARARGLSEEESVEAALEAFGDQEPMAEALWQANRGRMRLRAVVKWAARATLVPAALLLTLYLEAVAAQPWGIARALDGGPRLPSLWPVRRLELRPRRRLSAEERFLFDHMRQVFSDRGVALAGELVERYPHDPSFYAHYVRLLTGPTPSDPARLNAEELDGQLAVLDRGEAVEPGNALYNYLKAYMLMPRSSSLESEGGPCFRYRSRLQGGKEKESCGYRIAVDDRATFDRGMSAVFDGAAKPYHDAHATDMVKRKQELAGPPESLADFLVDLSVAGATLMPHLEEFRAMERRLVAYAGLLGTEGKKAEAARTLQAAERAAVQMGAGARTLIEFMVAQGCLHQVLGLSAEIYKQMGMPEEAAAVRQRFEAENDRWNALYANRFAEERRFRDEQKHYGLIYVMLAPGIPGFNHAILGVPLRLLEHVVVEQLMLAVLTAMLLVAAIACGVATLRSRWRYRGRADGPKLFFVGWRRMAQVALLAVILPIGLYLAYRRLAPFSSVRYGIHYEPWRILAEAAGLWAIVLLGVFIGGWRAIRTRCREAGTELPRAGFVRIIGTRLAIGAAAFLALPSVWYFVLATERGHYYGEVFAYGLGGCGALFLALFLLRGARRPAPHADAKTHFRITFVRSMTPILVACLLVMGVATHAYLRLTEAHYAGKIGSIAQRIEDEIEHSSFKLYRDHLRELNRQWLEEHKEGAGGAE